jgi:hypothetical protein
MVASVLGDRSDYCSRSTATLKTETVGSSETVVLHVPDFISSHPRAYSLNYAAVIFFLRSSVVDTIFVICRLDI